MTRERGRFGRWHRGSAGPTRTHADDDDTVVQDGDVLIVAGRNEAVEAFADVN